MNKNSNLYILVQYLTAILLVVAIPSYSESAVECDAPREVCDWRARIVGIKTPNMIASGILIEDGFDCHKPACRGRPSIDFSEEFLWGYRQR